MLAYDMTREMEELVVLDEWATIERRWLFSVLLIFMWADTEEIRRKSDVDSCQYHI